MVIFYNIKEISESIYKELKPKSRGKVHSIYKNTINIFINNQLISIQSANIPKTPMSISIENNNIDFEKLNIEIGEEVNFLKGRFVIKHHNFDYNLSKLWNPSINNLRFTGEEFNDNTIMLLCSLLKAYGNAGGLRDISLHFADPYFNRTTEKQKKDILIAKTLFIVQELMDNLVDGEITETVKGAANLIGMGPGLTPSGDDFLIGILSVFILIKTDIERIHQIRKRLMVEIHNSLDRTTFVSKEFLIYGCKGEFGETFHHFYAALIEGDLGKISISTMEFLKIGHTSGSDILSGIILGILLVNKFI